MRPRCRRAHGEPQPAPPAGRLRRWAEPVLIAALSALAILFTNGPAAEADEQPPAVKATGPVPGAGTNLDAPALARLIDQQIQRRLDDAGVKSSPKADDAEFLRRAYLDLVGRIPPAEKVVAFLDSKDPNKRARAIDELLADARYGRWMAETWTNVMVPRESNNRRLKSAP